MDELAQCNVCLDYFPVTLTKDIKLRDPNQRVLSPNTDKHIYVCSDCLTKISDNAKSKGWKDK